MDGCEDVNDLNHNIMYYIIENNAIKLGTYREIWSIRTYSAIHIKCISDCNLNVMPKQSETNTHVRRII